MTDDEFLEQLGMEIPRRRQYVLKWNKVKTLKELTSLLCVLYPAISITAGKEPPALLPYIVEIIEPGAEENRVTQ